MKIPAMIPVVIKLKATRAIVIFVRERIVRAII
jgi:hypothetical protein